MSTYRSLLAASKGNDRKGKRHENAGENLRQIQVTRENKVPVAVGEQLPPLARGPRRKEVVGNTREEARCDPGGRYRMREERPEPL